MASKTAEIGKPRKRLLSAVALAVSLAFTLVLIEAVSALYFEYLSPHAYRPIYLEDDTVLAMRTEFEPWGAWHKPNAAAVHRSACFAADNRSNSMGARDKERPAPGPPDSIVFLGDSFIEGFGVDEADRLSNIIEREAGRPSINLAASGDFGPLQYWMVYEALGRRFAHDTVVIGFLPSNDFTDNDPDFRRWRDEDYRYRPYYRKTETGYEVFHKGHAEPGRTMGQVGILNLPGGRSAILRYTWVGGFLFAYRGQLRARSIDIFRDPKGGGYFENSRERLDAAFYFLDRIIQSADAATKYILVIPTYAEALALRTNPSPWLAEFRTRFENARARVIDLGPIFAALPDEALRAAYLDCDGHWSPRGNRIAADVLTKVLGSR